jgi:hypothetical protein
VPPDPKKKGKAAPPSAAERAGKFFEIRKGAAPGAHEAEDDENAPPPIVALPRSITQEQEEADLKKRLNREELIEINKRNALVKVVGGVSEPSPLKRRSLAMWVVAVLLVLLIAAAFFADKYHLLPK